MTNRFLEAGKLVTTHGVRGELKLLPDTDGPAFLLPFQTLYWHDGTAVRVLGARVQNNCLLLRLAGVETAEQAAALVGRRLYFRRDDPAIPAGTVFLSDLIGLPVFADGVQIGQIAEVLQMPGSDVYVVRGQKEYLIPAVPAFVAPIDLSAGRIDVHLIEGMASDEG